MYFLIGVAIIIAIGFLESYLSKKSKEGEFLKKEVKPLFNKIMYYVDPYLNFGFAKDIRADAVVLLKSIYRQHTLNESAASKIVKNASDNDFAYYFSWMYLYWWLCKKPKGLTIQNTEENNVKYNLENRITKIIAEEYDNIPEPLQTEFDIDAKRIRDQYFRNNPRE